MCVVAKPRMVAGVRSEPIVLFRKIRSSKVTQRKGRDRMTLRLGRTERPIAFVFVSLVVCLSSLSAQSPAPAPIKVKLGDPIVDGTFLKPYKNAWKVVYAFPGKEPFLV